MIGAVVAVALLLTGCTADSDGDGPQPTMPPLPDVVTDCDTFGVAVQQRASMLESMFWVPLSTQAAGRASTTVSGS